MPEDEPYLQRARRMTRQRAHNAKVRAREMYEDVNYEDVKKLAGRFEDRNRGPEAETRAVFERAEDAATAGPPIDVGLEPMGGPSQLEGMARGGGSFPTVHEGPRGPPGRSKRKMPDDRDDGMSMEAFVTGGGEAARDDDDMAFDDPFGLGGGADD